jgi:ParB-like chromosome segregation protein Spo0J
MAKSKQTMENVKGKNVTQRSSHTSEQMMRGIEAAGDVQQLIEAADGDLDVIAAELEKLRLEMRKYDPTATVELNRLEKAEAAARAGNSSGVLNHLKGAGRWVVEFGTKVGTSIVAKIIEKQIGL